MIIHDVKQGTPEWLDIRAGIPTASIFERIWTAGGKDHKGKSSSQAESYMHTLLAERIMGHPVLDHISFWMQRGTECEAEAVAFYEMHRSCDTRAVGFITNDAGTIGASPDRILLDADGLLEIKVPKESTHVGYLLGVDSIDQAYYPQLQGQLWITGRQWVDILSYHPEMPPALIRVERNEEYIAALSVAVENFSRILETTSLSLVDRGIITSEQWTGRSIEVLVA